MDLLSSQARTRTACSRRTGQSLNDRSRCLSFLLMEDGRRFSVKFGLRRTTSNPSDMPVTKAYAAQGPTTPLAPFQIDRRELRPNDVQIEILFCGVCHSDIHMVRNEWKQTIYPIVPGHEIVGRVTAVGDKVSKFRRGDLVGVGVMVDSCRECVNCRQGLEQYCKVGMILTYSA